MGPFPLADVWRQPVEVMEGAGKSKERDDSREFMQDQEGGNVGDGGIAKRSDDALEEAWETRFEAGDTRCWCLWR